MTNYEFIKSYISTGTSEDMADIMIHITSLGITGWDNMNRFLSDKYGPSMYLKTNHGFSTIIVDDKKRCAYCGCVISDGYLCPVCEIHTKWNKKEKLND